MPLVHEAFVPLLGLSGATMRERVTKIRNMPAGQGMYTLTFFPDGTGDMGTACRSDQDWWSEDGTERGRGRVIVRGSSAYDYRCK